MKHRYRTIGAKAVCFALCILSLIMTVASVFAAVCMISAEIYTLPEGTVVESLNYELIRHNAYDLAYKALDVYGDHTHSIKRDYDADVTNMRFCFSDVITGEAIIQNGYDADASARVYSYYFDTLGYTDGSRDIIMMYGDENGSADYILNVYVDGSMKVYDGFAFIRDAVAVAYALKYWIYVIAVFCLGLCITAFVILMCASGRRRGTEEIVPGILTPVPIDILIAVTALIAAVGLELVVDVLYTGEAALVAMLIGWAVIAANMLLGLCMTIACRVKLKTLFSGTFIWWALKLIFRILKAVVKGIGRVFKAVFSLIRAIPLVWKTALIVTANLLVDLLLIFLAMDWYWYAEMYLTFLTVKNIFIAAAVIYIALSMRTLQKGGEAIAKGDVSYRVDTRRMPWDFKKHGEDLNSISDGITIALEQRLQSERTKTELITNVSHDIKTPLTSIINYANLISEESDPDKTKEYSDVLVRKSEHLKRLLDDLVEISKATTGNLEVTLSPCDAGVLLGQAAGEFEDRCRDAELELITSIPETPIRIMADSRRIWRVFENLMTNACKYSLKGSRVYLSLTKEGNQACFIFRNTSSAALNISAEELAERFVRGDSSRSTEGNGLGLSIARSLTELQGGHMDINIDGDLFKVTLRFPCL